MLINLPDFSTKILVGVSGGADSTFLLHYLMEQEVPGIVVCHLNHGLRGKEADADEEFVKGLAAQYDLPFEGAKVDLRAMMEAQGKASFEELGREARLGFFAQIGAQYHTRDVVLGHHADDQAETVIMNLCRGSAGLKGIDEESYLEQYNLNVWRPLLHVRKEEMVQWLEAQKLPWREDQTNHEAIAVRNRVRNELIPLMNEIFHRDVTPNINRGLEGDLRPVFHEIVKEMDVYDPQGRLFLPKLEQYTLRLQRSILHLYLKENGVPDVSFVKLEECLKLISEENVWKVNLPSDRFLRRKEKRIFIEL